MGYNRIKFRNSEILFTELRSRNTDYTKYGLHKYDIRHGDEDFGQPVTIEENVFANHYGTIFSKDKLDMDVDDWDGRIIFITEEEASDFWSQGDTIKSFEEYVKLVGGIELKIFLGIPTIKINDSVYEVHLFDRDVVNPFVEGYAFLFNEVVLPCRGAIQDYVGTILHPGIYAYNDKTVLILPNEDMDDYSIDKIQEK